MLEQVALALGGVHYRPEQRGGDAYVVAYHERSRVAHSRRSMVDEHCRGGIRDMEGVRVDVRSPIAIVVALVDHDSGLNCLVQEDVVPIVIVRPSHRSSARTLKVLDSFFGRTQNSS